MKEIEVGDYVRTKEGEIHKVIKIIEDDGDWDYYCCENNTGYFAMNIANHSKHLIDLIEVGDIINKELVIGIIDITNDKEEKVGRKLITQYRSAQFTGLDIKYYICADDIKTILTKEQFEANCYKIGGEDE